MTNDQPATKGEVQRLERALASIVQALHHLHRSQASRDVNPEDQQHVQASQQHTQEAASHLGVTLQ